ncbi:hypothetical protein [Nonomuraea sp. NPDC003804]|uniref:hypothetical protein n=1 Tax=Nonomuraea sp. NPDC003804 TaxID=3154547 RepID=UPI00339E77D4
MRTLATTSVLDWAHPQVARLAAEVQESDPRTALIAAHRLIAARLRPVYALDEFQPVSVTLALGKGSCSQRLAVLEAVARARGIATRVRGLQVDGRFWAARLGHFDTRDELFGRFRRPHPRGVLTCAVPRRARVWWAGRCPAVRQPAP